MVGLQDGRRNQRASFGFGSAFVTASGLEVAGSACPGAAWGWQGLGSLCAARAFLPLACRSTTLSASRSPDPPKLS